MNRQKACRILGIDGGFEEAQLKKRYREIMHLAHPDSSNSKYLYDAREINEAYDYLKKYLKDSTPSGYGQQREVKLHKYQAPQNPSAYAERTIFHKVEDEDGEILGTIEVAKGRYYWQKEEEFSLFLLSLYTCSREILSEYEDFLSKMDFEAFQAELSFLLSKQFIDHRAVLEELSTHQKTERGDTIYRVTAMLELDAAVSRRYFRKNSAQKIGILHPALIRGHKLYLQDDTGEELGYLSFADDRLYYIIIPLFEGRKVQVRFASDGEIRKMRSGKAYLDVRLDLKFTAEGKKNVDDMTDREIEKVIEKCKKSIQR